MNDSDRAELRKTSPCPTRHGTQSAYMIEYRDGPDEKWKEARTVESRDGVPDSRLNRVVHCVGLRGYEQAMALAWQYLAHARADDAWMLEVRVVPYEIEYDIKAWRNESAAKVLPRFLDSP